MRIKKVFNPDKLFFTSDNHFYHENAIRYCSRPFKNAHEMNNKLIENWNNVVGADDDVIIAGDFIHSGNLELIGDILSRLNGIKWFIFGNHCYKNKFDRQIVMDSFDNRMYDVMSISVKDADFEDGKRRFFISHYPHLYWERDTWHVHGHIHSGPLSTASEVTPFHPLRIDIGVDAWDYKPVSYRTLKAKFLEQIEIGGSRRNLN